jgi:outer membrane protein assembly factor BamB
MFGAGMRSSPAYSNGMVFGAWNGKLWAVDAANGSALWSYALPAKTVIYGGITIVDGGLLAGTSNAHNYWCFSPGGK